MLDIYILKIGKALPKDVFNRFLSLVSDVKKERILRYRMYEDAQRSLLGDILARYAICKRLGIRNHDLVFGTNEYGKPILTIPGGVHFNISHSENWVVCAADNNQVGIDVEVIKPVNINIAESFFSKYEYLALLNQPEETQLKYFYMIWTLKESYIKAEGKGLSIPLNSFTVRKEGNNINAIVDNKARELFFHQSFLDCDTIYAVCTSCSNISKIIRMGIGCENVINFIDEAGNCLGKAK